MSDVGQLRAFGTHGQPCADYGESSALQAHEQCVGILERGKQVLARDSREVDDLVARLAQQVEPGGRDLLRDDDAAHADSPALSSSAASRASSDARSTSPMWPMRKVVAFHLP